MISKQLLSEVLDYPIIKDSMIDDDNMVKVHFKNFQTKYENDEINIYELAHKCKVWAILNHYDFTILIDTIVIYNEGIQIYTIYNTLEDDNFIPFDPIYEIKACQWILDNKSGSSE